MIARTKLLNIHKIKRISFAKKYMSWNDKWKTVVFTDEKKWNLDGPDDYKFYWADKDNINEKFFSKRQNRGGGIMVWGAIILIVLFH